MSDPQPQGSWLQQHVKGVVWTAVAGILLVIGAPVFLWIEGQFGAADVNVVAFDMGAATQGSKGTASITVRNDGPIGGAKCIVTWDPGTLYDNQGNHEEMTSREFAMSTGQSLTFNWTSTHTYGNDSIYDATASVTCSNSGASTETKTVFIAPDLFPG